MTDKPNKPFNLNMHTARLLMSASILTLLSLRCCITLSSLLHSPMNTSKVS